MIAEPLDTGLAADIEHHKVKTNHIFIFMSIITMMS